MIRYLDEFRDQERVKRLVDEIIEIQFPEKVNIMEVCGTHTMSIRRFGIHKLVESKVNLISGPGCPVCVTPVSYMDMAIWLSQRDDVIITTFGDMVKVPGTRGSLQDLGRDVRVVYSPIESIGIAEQNPYKKVVFLAVGFETTVPTIAATVAEAKKRGLDNFFILEGNKIMPPPLRILLDDRDMHIDGFLLPGHVCTVSGYVQYGFIASEYGKTAVVSGFEPVDILLAISEILRLIKKREPSVKNMYPRAVRPEGNRKAMELVYDVFETTDAEWRGLGTISGSGLVLREPYREFSAERHFEIPDFDSHEHPLCICGEVLKGKAVPEECELFARGCTPDHPLGPCMVSSEGTCAAHYRYRNPS